MHSAIRGQPVFYRPQHSTNNTGHSCHPLLATPNRQRKSQRGSFATLSYAGAFSGSSSTFAAVQTLSNIASALAVGVGAWYFLSRQQQQQEGTQECPKCGGTGMVECFCTRWSDGDVGCGSCRGTGKTVCSACGGGGTAVPITAKLHIEKTQNPSGPFLQ
jgi:hypothetical protein